jgi:hypothetical protein
MSLRHCSRLGTTYRKTTTRDKRRNMSICDGSLTTCCHRTALYTMSYLLLALSISFLLIFSCGQAPLSTPNNREKRYCMSANIMGADKTDAPNYHCTHEDSDLTYDEAGREYRKGNKRIGTAIAQRIDGKDRCFYFLVWRLILLHRLTL